MLGSVLNVHQEERSMLDFGPRTKELTADEETVEILEIIEGCDDYSDLNDDDTDYEIFEAEE